MAELERQHVSDPGLALLVHKILALHETTVLELGHLHRLALGHLHSMALEVQLDVLGWVRLCTTFSHH